MLCSRNAVTVIGVIAAAHNADGAMRRPINAWGSRTLPVLSNLGAKKDPSRIVIYQEMLQLRRAFSGWSR
jgi:hypothetical protein